MRHAQWGTALSPSFVSARTGPFASPETRSSLPPERRAPVPRRQSRRGRTAGVRHESAGLGPRRVARRDRRCRRADAPGRCPPSGYTFAASVPCRSTRNERESSSARRSGSPLHAVEGAPLPRLAKLDEKVDGLSLRLEEAHQALRPAEERVQRAPEEGAARSPIGWRRASAASGPRRRFAA